MLNINELFNHYGYIVLLFALMLELVALPLPGEVLMSYCGFLVFQRKLNWILSIFIASTGAMVGITIAYFVGSILGLKFFRKYGRYVHLGPERLDKTSQWFEQYGNKLIVIAYFVPGVRHITGYFSGITKISFSRFAINAYIGAVLWTTTFISLGKVLGPNWEQFHISIKKYLIIGSIIIAIIIVIAYLIKFYRARILQYGIKTFNYAIEIFHSLGRIRIIVTFIAAMFLVLSFTVIGLIQDFLANEFKDFDTIVSLLVKSTFGDKWNSVMLVFSLVISPISITLLSLLIFSWILVKEDNKFLETKFLLLIVLGGELIEESLRHIFHRVGPAGNYTFPSEQTFVAIVIYGFAVYMINRKAQFNYLKKFISVGALIICIFAGLSPIFLHTQYPSDVAAGYAFGGVWLSLNIVLLEVLRILPKINI